MTCDNLVKCPLPKYPTEMHELVCTVCKLQGYKTDKLWHELNKGEQHGETE